ncbi:hypothetical protein C8Q76DRAFT_689628 [Earliella scabrosa]|nr:hypothetical protein C8Q76DRAFT_689628 [Earliella scabrosa]
MATSGTLNEAHEMLTATIRNPASQSPVDIFARWKGYSPQSHKNTHVYRLQARPPRPLAVGTQARILATSPVAYRIPGVLSQMQDTYDAHVMGRVTDISFPQDGWVTIGIENECKVNPVKRAEVEVPFAPGVTIEECDGLHFLVVDENALERAMETLCNAGWFYTPQSTSLCSAQHCAHTRARHKYDIPGTHFFRVHTGA